jgi:adenosine 3'-phospho 5'-phosphosulfate transporter B2
MLVFMNRFLAMLVAWVALQIRPSANSAPPYKYTICSVSNVISSWLQYEALKFVNFPLQVVMI